MRILLVTPGFYPSTFGGVKNYVTVLSRELAKLGHEVTVYTSNALDFNTNLDLIGEHDYMGVKIVYLKNYFPKKYWHTPGIIKRLMLDRGSYDIIHLNNNYSYMNVFVYMMARIYNIPIVYSAHGSLTVRYRNIIPKKLYNRYISKYILNYASRVLALNEQEKEQYVDFGIANEKIDIIPLGIDLNEYEPVDDKSFRAKHGIDQNVKLVVFIGRLHPIKGIDSAIKAMRKLVDDSYNVKFVIVGPDFGHYNFLIELVEKLDLTDDVLFVGPLYGNDKMEVLCGSDIFILPSVSDMFPTTVLEAGYCGLPIILSDGVLLSDKMKNEGTVIVKRDAGEIANAIKQMIDDKEYRLMLGKRAKHIVECEYNSQMLSKRTLNLYSSILIKSDCN